MQKNILTVLSSILLLICLTGCVFNVDSNRSNSGSLWSDADVSALKRGDTTSDWVLRAIGEPDNKVYTEQGSEIWQYLSSNVERTDVSFIFLFHIDLDNETNRHLSIEIENSKVIDYWVRTY